MLEKIVPIPPEFYDDHKDEDLITGKGTIFPFAVFLYFMQWAAFLGFILFYWYHPSSQVTQSKMENNYDYGKASGWNCTPLLNDPFYKSRMNYETCKAIMIKPKLDDIKTMKINIDPDCIETDDNNCTQATAFRFMPFKGSEGLLGRRGVVQPGSLIENTFDSTNTDAIKAELKKIFEPLAGLTRCSAFGMHWKNKGGWGVSRVNKLASFDIFVDQMKKKDAPAQQPLHVHQVRSSGAIRGVLAGVRQRAAGLLHLLRGVRPDILRVQQEEEGGGGGSRRDGDAGDGSPRTR